MSRELEEIMHIRKRMENLESVVKSYQQKTEELREREQTLLKKLETMETKFSWKEFLQESRKPDDCILSETVYVMLDGIETPQMRRETITKLREEIVQKQRDNMRLEKQLESQRKEHRLFHELLERRRAGLEIEQSDWYTESETD